MTPAERRRIYEEEKAKIAEEEAARFRSVTAQQSTRQGKDIKNIITVTAVVLITSVILAILLAYSGGGSSKNKSDYGGTLPDTSTDAEKVERGCKVARAMYGRRKISDLSLDQVQLLNHCSALGY